jgi:hypothetical protein
VKAIIGCWGTCIVLAIAAGICFDLDLIGTGTALSCCSFIALMAIGPLSE